MQYKFLWVFEKYKINKKSGQFIILHYDKSAIVCDCSMLESIYSFCEKLSKNPVVIALTVVAAGITVWQFYHEPDVFSIYSVGEITEEEKFVNNIVRTVDISVASGAYVNALEDLRYGLSKYPQNNVLLKYIRRVREQYYQFAFSSKISNLMLSSKQTGYSSAKKYLDAMIKKFPEKKEEIVKLKKDLNIYYEKRNEVDDIMKTYNSETIYALNKIKKLCESYQYNYFIMKNIQKII